MSSWYVLLPNRQYIIQLFFFPSNKSQPQQRKNISITVTGGGERGQPEAAKTVPTGRRLSEELSRRKNRILTDKRGMMQNTMCTRKCTYNRSTGFEVVQDQRMMSTGGGALAFLHHGVLSPGPARMICKQSWRRKKKHVVEVLDWEHSMANWHLQGVPGKGGHTLQSMANRRVSMIAVLRSLVVSKARTMLRSFLGRQNIAWEAASPPPRTPHSWNRIIEQLDCKGSTMQQWNRR